MDKKNGLETICFSGWVESGAPLKKTFYVYRRYQKDNDRGTLPKKI